MRHAETDVIHRRMTAVARVTVETAQRPSLGEIMLPIGVGVLLLSALSTRPFGAARLEIGANALVTRQAALRYITGVGLGVALPALAADADEVVQCTLQVPKGETVPPTGSVAVVTLRVVGRNSKGPLATMNVPIDSDFPISFTMTRSSLREGVPDFLWESEDIYVKADVVSPSGKSLVAGRSKAKFITVDGTPSHAPAYVTLDQF